VLLNNFNEFLVGTGSRVFAERLHFTLQTTPHLEQLLHEGTATPAQFVTPVPLHDKQVLAVHDAQYWQKLTTQTLSRQEERRTGFPLSAALVEREVAINGGTLQCARYALAGDGVALNVAGGTHHAFADRGEGFCLLNDLALTAKILLAEGRVRQVLIVDLDVHQGDGTAASTADTSTRGAGRGALPARV